MKAIEENVGWFCGTTPAKGFLKLKSFFDQIAYLCDYRCGLDVYAFYIDLLNFLSYLSLYPHNFTIGHL